MGKNESGISHLPENIQSALAREPVILGRESVGEYFRNEGEIADVEELIARQKDGTIAMGLVGSRLRGKFYYPAQGLFDRFCDIFPGFVREIAELTDEEQHVWGRSDSIPIPERFQQPFDEITAFLNSAQANHTNLDDIDFSRLSLSLQDLIKFAPFDRGLSPQDMINMGLKKLHTRVFLPPGVYFPDIDIALILPNPPRADLARFRQTFGTQSGISIELVPINPFKSSPYPRPREEVKTIASMISNFRPLTMPTPAE